RLHVGCEGGGGERGGHGSGVAREGMAGRLAPPGRGRNPGCGMAGLAGAAAGTGPHPCGRGRQRTARWGAAAYV
ncbi:MAG TPA: hypothetical protein VGC15_24980, partial [Acetobacteraceae bacterium]